MSYEIFPNSFENINRNNKELLALVKTINKVKKKITEEQVR